MENFALQERGYPLSKPTLKTHPNHTADSCEKSGPVKKYHENQDAMSQVQAWLGSPAEAVIPASHHWTLRPGMEETVSYRAWVRIYTLRYVVWCFIHAAAPQAELTLTLLLREPGPLKSHSPPGPQICFPTACVKSCIELRKN